MAGFPMGDTTLKKLAAYEQIGVDRFVFGLRYETEAQYREQIDRLRLLLP